jgi:type II restriction/modification system DNA methylase subunit YeeA
VTRGSEKRQAPQLLKRSRQKDSKDITQQSVTASKETHEKEIIRKFFKYLVETNLTFRAVENKSFRRLLVLLDVPKAITTVSK